MAYGYSYELRTRALAALDSGLSRNKVSEIFQVSTRTLYNWCVRRTQTGDVHCKHLTRIRSTRKLTREKLLSYLDKHPDHYLKEIADFFGVRPQSVSAALKKFGISRKKNDTLLRARRKKEARISSRNRGYRS